MFSVRPLLVYWHESIKMLRWSELKLLIFDSIKMFGKSFILLTKYFWWLFVLVGGIGLLFPKEKSVEPVWPMYLKIANESGLGAFFFLIIIVIILSLLYFCLFWFVPLFFIYLTARPTTEIKKFTYYRKYLPMFWRYFAISVSMLIIFMCVKYYTNLDIKGLAFIFLTCFLVVNNSVFFLLDFNQKIITSIKRGNSLVFCFFPLFIVLQIPLIAEYLLEFFFKHQNYFILPPYLTSFSVEILSGLFLSLVSVSFSATLYAKIKDKYPEFFLFN